MKFSLDKCTSPRYSVADNSTIDVDLHVTNDDGSTEIMPFTASPNDSVAHGRDIFARAAKGDYGAVAAYKKP